MSHYAHMLNFQLRFSTFHFWMYCNLKVFSRELQRKTWLDVYRVQQVFEPTATYCLRIKNLLLHYMHIYGALQTFTVSSLQGLHLRQISTSDTTSPDDITQTQLEHMSDLVLSVNSSKTSSQTCPASKAVYSIAADSHDRTAINMSNNVCLFLQLQIQRVSFSPAIK